MSISGVTRTCTISAILDALDRAGGSVARVFRQADVSPRLIEDPRRLILLKDQFLLLQATAREIGDATVAAQLSVKAGIDGLGSYGYWIASQSTLREAIRISINMLPSALQTATRVQLRIQGRWAQWSYEVEDSAVFGRRQNDLLCIGYVLDVFRRFCGPGWSPHRFTVAGSTIEARGAVEAVFGCTLEPGVMTAMTFPAAMLDCHNLAPLAPKPFRPLLQGDDALVSVVYAIASGLGERRPDLPRTARRLGVASRTLQRRLREHGTSFEQVLDRTLADHAKTMLEEPGSLTTIAYDLGFSDPAHFSRAFKRWTGVQPAEWRRRQIAFVTR